MRSATPGLVRSEDESTFVNGTREPRIQRFRKANAAEREPHLRGVGRLQCGQTGGACSQAARIHSVFVSCGCREWLLVRRRAHGGAASLTNGNTQ